MAFQLHQVTHTYMSQRGKVTALQALDLVVKEEEFVCIVGPSGCGKTTLLKIIAGLITPSGGYITFSSENSRPQNAMVFQDQGLFPWMTIIENVAFGLEMRGVPLKVRQAAAEAFLARVGLGEFLNNYPHELSGGMRQRVAILRAFLTDPHILLMDEPFGALDAQTRLVMQDELLKIWREHRKTVVYITHDIDEAVHMADRILVMSGRPGTIKAEIEVPFKRQPMRMGDVQPELLKIRENIWQMIEDEVRRDLGITA